MEQSITSKISMRPNSVQVRSLECVFHGRIEGYAFKRGRFDVLFEPGTGHTDIDGALFTREGLTFTFGAPLRKLSGSILQVNVPVFAKSLETGGVCVLCEPFTNRRNCLQRAVSKTVIQRVLVPEGPYRLVQLGNRGSAYAQSLAFEVKLGKARLRLGAFEVPTQPEVADIDGGLTVRLAEGRVPDEEFGDLFELIGERPVIVKYQGSLFTLSTGVPDPVTVTNYLVSEFQEKDRLTLLIEGHPAGVESPEGIFEVEA